MREAVPCLKKITCVISALWLAACVTTPPPVIGPAVIEPSVELGQSDFSYAPASVYFLRPSDKISIDVFREPTLSVPDVRLGVDGSISVPMLGTLPASGMTTQQLEEELTRRLAAAGLRSPMVSVNLAEYASHFVTVEGAVKEPGVYAFRPGGRLSSAIAMGKGVLPVAKTSQVAVFRETEDGIMVAKFDYGRISQGTMLDPILLPNDRVVMGTSGLAAFWQDLIKTIPAFGVFAIIAARQ